MDFSATLEQVKALSIGDRIRLVQAIWDSIGEEPEQIELTEAQKLELSCRLKHHKANPQAVISWESIKSQALSRTKDSE